MKKYTFIVLSTLFTVTGSVAQDDIKKSVELKVSDFIAVSEYQDDIKEGKQPISTKKDVEKLIELVNTKFGEQGTNEMGEISAWINRNLSFTNNNVEFNDNVGIVFLHHELDVDKLKRADEEKRGDLQCELFNLKAEIQILESHEKELETRMRLNKQLIQSEFLFYLLDIHEKLNSNLTKTQSTLDLENGDKSVFSDVVLKKDGTLESAKVKLTSDKKQKLIESLGNLSLTTSEKNKIVAAIKKAEDDSDIIGNTEVQKIIRYRLGQTQPIVSLNLDIIKLINSLRERRREKEEEFEKLKTEYLALFNVFEEKEGVNNYLLHQGTKKIEYTEYMLETREFLVIIFGGKEDIANSEIQIENKKSAFSTSADNLIKVVKQLGIGDIDISNYFETLESADGTDVACEKVVEDPDESSLQVSFILISIDKVKPPSSLRITHESMSEIKYEIHEKVRAQLRVGISGANLDRKDFFLDPGTGNFVVQPDSTQAEEWKSNGFALIEVYPGGRDIDRFESIFKKNNQTPVWSRFSLALGLKLSSDPLEAIYTGTSFSLDRSTSITAGFSFQSTAEDTPSEGVLNSANATLEYLQNNVDREYVPKFFIGLSISPGRLGEIIGSGE